MSTTKTNTLPAWAVEVQDVGREVDGKPAGFIRGPATTVDASEGSSRDVLPDEIEVRAEQYFEATQVQDVRVTITTANAWVALTPQQARDLAAALVDHAATVEAIR